MSLFLSVSVYASISFCASEVSALYGASTSASASASVPAASASVSAASVPAASASAKSSASTSASASAASASASASTFASHYVYFYLCLYLCLYLSLPLSLPLLLEQTLDACWSPLPLHHTHTHRQSVYQEMRDKTPEKMVWVIRSVVIVTTILYLMVGLSGLQLYGDQVTRNHRFWL